MKTAKRKRLIDAVEAGELAGCHWFTVWRWGRDGKIRRYQAKAGRAVRYDAAEVRKYAADRGSFDC